MMKTLQKICSFVGICSLILTACDPLPQNAQPTPVADDILNGCYTVSRDEPAQIKISKTGEQYLMQMREFNDPKKAWDKGEPLQLLANNDPELSKYFDIKADEHHVIEKVIARADRVFVLAKISESFANINPQFDSQYLGFIYQGSNTIYKVTCENPTQ